MAIFEGAFDDTRRLAWLQETRLLDLVPPDAFDVPPAAVDPAAADDQRHAIQVPVSALIDV